ncbi:hypothetical protein D3C74_81890 [compost metagenome]
MSRISVSLSDLRRAVQQCEQLRQRLQQQEQHMRSIYARLQDWRGESALELSRKMEAFVQGASARMQELESHKAELERYIRKMEEADREERRKRQAQ